MNEDMESKIGVVGLTIAIIIGVFTNHFFLGIIFGFLIWIATISISAASKNVKKCVKTNSKPHPDAVVLPITIAVIAAIIIAVSAYSCSTSDSRWEQKIEKYEQKKEKKEAQKYRDRANEWMQENW